MTDLAGGAGDAGELGQARPEAPGVGETLARARQAQGLAIADVAQQLKFMSRHIEALEQERFTSLPGPTIARGMVRSYAKFLKLDAEPLLANLAGRFKVPDGDNLAARFSQPVPFSDSGRRSTVVYLALSACVLAIAGAAVYEWRDRANPEFVVAAIAPAPVPARPPRQTASAAPASPVAIQAEAAQPPAAPVPPAQVAGEPKAIGANRIVLQFDREAWTEVTDGAGRLLVSSLNAAGSERVVQGKPPFNLVIGNASHVRVSYNDQAVDLGPHVKVEVARFTLK